MVLIKLWADSYYMPYCSLTLLEAYSSTLMLKSSHIFNDCDTYAYDYPLIRHQSSQISYIKKEDEYNYLMQTIIYSIPPLI